MRTDLSRTNPLRMPHRRGVVFHSYMVYLFLTSALLTASGICLHIVLDADHADERLSGDLRTLLRLDLQIRMDAADAIGIEVAPDAVMMQQNADETIRWSIDQHRIRRQHLISGTVHAADVYAFTRGTDLTVAADNSGLVRLQITDAPVVKEEDSKSVTPRQSVEIVVAAPGQAARLTGASAEDDQ